MTGIETILAEYAAKAIGAIAGLATAKVVDKAAQTEHVLRILNRIGFNTVPKSDFVSVYVHALIEYGINKQQPALEIFKHKFVQDGFRRGFQTGDSKIALEEINTLLEVNQDLKASFVQTRLEPHDELTKFQLAFEKATQAAKSVVDVGHDHQLARIAEMLELLLQRQPGETARDRVRRMADKLSELPVGSMIPSSLLDELMIFWHATDIGIARAALMAVIDLIDRGVLPVSVLSLVKRTEIKWEIRRDAIDRINKEPPSVALPVLAEFTSNGWHTVQTHMRQYFEKMVEDKSSSCDILVECKVILEAMQSAKTASPETRNKNSRTIALIDKEMRARGCAQTLQLDQAPPAISMFLITEWMPAGIDLLEAAEATIYDPALWRDRARLFELLVRCDALIVRNQTQVDAELLGHAPNLKVVGRLGVGLDNLDLNALRERSITVVTGGSANAISVAEYTLAAMLVLARKLPAADRSTKAGEWDRATFGAGVELYGKTLGLIGLGDIGARVAKRADAFGMRAIAHDPLITSSHFAAAEFGIVLLPLDDVLRTSDFVSLHVPLLPATKHLLNAERIALMKPTAILINTSRGGIVDEAALADALHAKRLGGAALDVREHEPPGADDPLARCENVLLTPHVAGLTVESQERVCTAVAQDVLRVLRGERAMSSVK